MLFSAPTPCTNTDRPLETMLLRTLQFAALVAASSAVDITGSFGGYATDTCTTLTATGTLRNYTFGECVVGTGGLASNTSVIYNSTKYSGNCGAITVMSYAAADCTGAATPDTVVAVVLNSPGLHSLVAAYSRCTAGTSGGYSKCEDLDARPAPSNPPSLSLISLLCRVRSHNRSLTPRLSVC